MEKEDQGNIILVHKGALGDFLIAWPLFLSIRSRFPGADIYWHGREAFLPWLEPLGIHKVGPGLGNALDSLYSRSCWPEALQGYTVFWFGLDKVTVPAHRDLVYLTGIETCQCIHVRTTYAAQLETQGIPFRNDWHEVWLRHFSEDHPPEHALIFPGSGHHFKNWSLENFVWAAQHLEQSGLQAKLVLGPAEENLDLPDSAPEHILCRDLAELQRLIQKSVLLVGNDSGPMHLGAMFQVPGLVLFGPTPTYRWAPQGMQHLESPAECAPCTATARINCSHPICMSSISREQVRLDLDKLLRGLNYFPSRFL